MDQANAQVSRVESHIWTISQFEIPNSPEEDNRALEGGSKVESRVRVAFAGGALAEVTYHREPVLRPLERVRGAGSYKLKFYFMKPLKFNPI